MKEKSKMIEIILGINKLDCLNKINIHRFLETMVTLNTRHTVKKINGYTKTGN